MSISTEVHKFMSNMSILLVPGSFAKPQDVLSAGIKMGTELNMRLKNYNLSFRNSATLLCRLCLVLHLRHIQVKESQLQYRTQPMEKRGAVSWEKKQTFFFNLIQLPLSRHYSIFLPQNRLLRHKDIGFFYFTLINSHIENTTPI